MEVESKKNLRKGKNFSVVSSSPNGQVFVQANLDNSLQEDEAISMRDEELSMSKELTVKKCFESKVVNVSIRGDNCLVANERRVGIFSYSK